MRRGDVYLDYSALESRCRFETLRRSGPGGQNRNKVETGVRFYHLATGLVGEATELRAQGKNRRNALERLRLKLALTQRESVELHAYGGVGDERLSSREDFRWFARLQAGRLCVSCESFDYPILVAEFFDVFYACGYDLKRTSALLETSSSQIIKFLSARPVALETLNRLRESIGAGRLRP